MRWSIALLMAGVCSAQTYTIHTFAGGGAPQNTPCTTADLFDSSAIAADSAGNLFLAVTQNGTVVRCGTRR